MLRSVLVCFALCLCASLCACVFSSVLVCCALVCVFRSVVVCFAPGLCVLVYGITILITDCPLITMICYVQCQTNNMCRK